MTFAICDDNTSYSEMLFQKINSCFQKTNGSVLPSHIVLPPYKTGNKLLESMKEQQIDVVFLDIDMPEIDGFDLAKIINERFSNSMIVFVSAHEDYVFDSFDYSPTYFLRKTKTDEELENLLLKIISKLDENNLKITISTHGKDEVVFQKDIEYVESSGNYTSFHLISNRTIQCRGALRSFEKDLSCISFIKVHPAFYVNKEHIKFVDYNNLCLTTINDHKIIISRRRLMQFKKEFLLFTRKKEH